METNRGTGQERFQEDLNQAVEKANAEAGRAHVGTDAAIRSELIRRLLIRDTPAEDAPEYHKEHATLVMIAGPDASRQALAARILDQAAAMMDQDRRARKIAEDALANSKAEAARALSERSANDGYPEDMQAALEDAIRAHGRAGHEAARRRLGDKVYDAIRGLGYGCGWSWLCQQPATHMPDIARKVDRVLGRSHLPPRPYEDRHGGGTHKRNQTPAQRIPVSSEKLPEVLLPQVRIFGYWLPIDDLKELNLTASDWNSLLGRMINKAKSGFIRPEGFGAYFLAAARRWEADHPIKTSK